MTMRFFLHNDDHNAFFLHHNDDDAYFLHNDDDAACFCTMTVMHVFAEGTGCVCMCVCAHLLVCVVVKKAWLAYHVYAEHVFG